MDCDVQENEEGSLMGNSSNTAPWRANVTLNSFVYSIITACNVSTFSCDQDEYSYLVPNIAHLTYVMFVPTYSQQAPEFYGCLHHGEADAQFHQESFLGFELSLFLIIFLTKDDLC